MADVWRWVWSQAASSTRLEAAVRATPAALAVVHRFVAGDHLDDGLRAARDHLAAGAAVTIDHVGEHVVDDDAADRAAEAYAQVLDALGPGEDVGISVKPTQLGLHLDADRCRGRLAELAAAASDRGVALTLDMEDHRVTEATVQLAETLGAATDARIVVALQAALHRTPRDVRRVTDAGVAVRLCKGAYAEPSHLAHARPVAVLRAYLDAARYLVRHGHDPRFATHDHRLLAAVRRDAALVGRAPDTYEFQMLHGVRSDAQRALVRDGERLRVYVPFGTAWFPYFTRRLAERPANLALLLRALTDQETS